MTNEESRTPPESAVVEVGAPFDYTPSETQFHDAATLLLAVYTVLWDEQSLADAVPWAQRVVQSVDHKDWAHGKHDGDCTHAAMTCGRCMMDDFLNEAHHYFDSPPEPTTKFTWRTEALTTEPGNPATPASDGVALTAILAYVAANLPEHGNVIAALAGRCGPVPEREG